MLRVAMPSVARYFECRLGASLGRAPYSANPIIKPLKPEGTLTLTANILIKLTPTGV
jgi:hypothetical protein